MWIRRHVALDYPYFLHCLHFTHNTVSKRAVCRPYWCERGGRVNIVLFISGSHLWTCVYNLAIRKCTSPPLLAPRLKIFKWKFTTPPGIEPRICWTRGKHATIWASALIMENNELQRNIGRGKKYRLKENVCIVLPSVGDMGTTTTSLDPLMGFGETYLANVKIVVM